VPSARGIAKRAADPVLAVLDRRLQELAVRLERHTSGLAADQARRFEQLDARVQLDLRVVDEHLLAMARVAEAPVPASSIVTEVDGSPVLLALPGAPLGAAPDGYRIDAVSALVGDGGQGWRVLDDRTETLRTDTLRIARLAPAS
jgi:hypothetical protein